MTTLPYGVRKFLAVYYNLRCTMCEALKTVYISSYVADLTSNALKLVYIGNQIGNMKSHNQSCYKLVITHVQLLVPIYHIWDSCDVKHLCLHAALMLYTTTVPYLVYGMCNNFFLLGMVREERWEGKARGRCMVRKV